MASVQDGVDVGEQPASNLESTADVQFVSSNPSTIEEASVNDISRRQELRAYRNRLKACTSPSIWTSVFFSGENQRFDAWLDSEQTPFDYYLFDGFRFMAKASEIANFCQRLPSSDSHVSFMLTHSMFKNCLIGLYFDIDVSELGNILNIALSTFTEPYMGITHDGVVAGSLTRPALGTVALNIYDESSRYISRDVTPYGFLFWYRKTQSGKLLVAYKLPDLSVYSLDKTDARNLMTICLYEPALGGARFNQINPTAILKKVAFDDRVLDYIGACYYQFASSNIFNGILCIWIFTIGILAEKLIALEDDLQSLEFSIMTLSGKEALQTIKLFRAQLGQFRIEVEAAKNLSEVSGVPVNSTSITTCPQFWPIQGQDVTYEPAAPEALILRQLRSMNDKARGLTSALNQQLQIVIATITVEETAVATVNNRRATQLTLLAAIYLPLTLGTGIFGMNIREVNGSMPSWKWPFIVSIVLLIPSAIFVVIAFADGQRLKSFFRRERWMIQKTNTRNFYSIWLQRIYDTMLRAELHKLFEDDTNLKDSHERWEQEGSLKRDRLRKQVEARRAIGGESIAVMELR